MLLCAPAAAHVCDYQVNKLFGRILHGLKLFPSGFLHRMIGYDHRHDDIPVKTNIGGVYSRCNGLCVTKVIL